jgi:hypothetical protein
MVSKPYSDGITVGEVAIWVTGGHPDGWPVALLASRAGLQEVHRMPVTGFLATLAANQLGSRILPDDLLSRPSHQFTSLG